VTTDDEVMDAARMLAEQSLPALLVLDTDNQPYAIVPGSQLIRQLIPVMAAAGRQSRPHHAPTRRQEPLHP
jgi:signal-transduction protein with cAMP-binding, CBS, and nucleotidyltransferase domain